MFNVISENTESQIEGSTLSACPTQKTPRTEKVEESERHRVANPFLPALLSEYPRIGEQQCTHRSTPRTRKDEVCQALALFPNRNVGGQKERVTPTDSPLAFEDN